MAMRRAQGLAHGLAILRLLWATLQRDKGAGRAVLFENCLSGVIACMPVGGLALLCNSHEEVEEARLPWAARVSWGSILAQLLAPQVAHVHTSSAHREMPAHGAKARGMYLSIDREN
jgi:hypothetical protein